MHADPRLTPDILRTLFIFIVPNPQATGGFEASLFKYRMRCLSKVFGLGVDLVAVFPERVHGVFLHTVTSMAVTSRAQAEPLPTPYITV